MNFFLLLSSAGEKNDTDIIHYKTAVNIHIAQCTEKTHLTAPNNHQKKVQNETK